ncbi:MAG: cytochrome P450 [Janthinobacterium lividum]
MSVATSPVPLLSLHDLEADPHGVFRRYRPVTPAITREGGGLIVLRAHDVERLMRDPRVRQAETDMLDQRGVTDGALRELFEYGMLSSNGEAHRRRRSPFTRTFASAMITALRPTIRRSAEALIARWPDEPGLDFVAHFAAPLPAKIISVILGLPPEDIPYFTRLVYSVSHILSFTYAPEDLPRMQTDARELSDYVKALLARRRAAPQDDLLSAFLADADARGELSALEMVIQIVSLIIGGTDTTRVGLTSIVSLLLQHRAQWDALCADPGLVRKAAAEGLRLEPSAGSVPRVAAESFDLDGVPVRSGQFVTLSTMSAMRDETVYRRPDAFDIHRPDARQVHLIFGGGAHRCIGESLAWAELEEGLNALAAACPGLRLAGAPASVWGHMGIRRVGAMQVAW